jgi:hypothetical protein
MALDVPIAIRVLELLAGGPMAFRALHDGVQADSGADADVVSGLLDVLRQESALGWTIADAGAERAATLRDAAERGDSVSCAILPPGIATLEGWKSAQASGGWTVEDQPVELAVPLSPPPKHPNARSNYLLWEARLVITAADPGRADAAFAAFASLLPHVIPAATTSETVGMATRRVVHYRFKRRYVLRFDCAAIRFRGGPPERQRLDLPWQEVAAVGIGEIDLALDGPFLVIRMTDGRTWSWDAFGAPSRRLVEFAKCFPGADRDVRIFGPQRKPWFWERAKSAAPDLPSLHARFFDLEEIRARERAEERERAAARASHEAEVAKIRGSRWRRLFWRADGTRRASADVVLLLLGGVALGLAWTWLFGKK